MSTCRPSVVRPQPTHHMSIPTLDVLLGVPYHNFMTQWESAKQFISHDLLKGNSIKYIALAVCIQLHYQEPGRNSFWLSCKISPKAATKEIQSIDVYHVCYILNIIFIRVCISSSSNILHGQIPCTEQRQQCRKSVTLPDCNSQISKLKL